MEGHVSRDIREAKQKLPLPTLMYRLGLGEHAKKSARCPFHDDAQNSFSVWQNNGAWFWKCFVGCGKGDEINFLESHKSISRSDATKLFLEMAGVNGCAPDPTKQNETSSNSAFNWHACVEAVNEKHLERLANWRAYSVELCLWLKENGLVGLYNDCIAFPVHDRAGNVVAVHYRLKDGSWRYYPKGAKVRPLLIGELVAGEPVQAFESQWDGFDYMDKSGERNGIIITRSANNGRLVADVIPERAKLFVWPQNDEPGEKWAKDVCAHVKCSVKRVKIPAPYKDLNDWARTGATAEFACAKGRGAMCPRFRQAGPVVRTSTGMGVN